VNIFHTLPIGFVAIEANQGTCTFSSWTFALLN